MSASVDRGRAWLTRLIGPTGEIADSSAVSLYYKVPATLALSGDRRMALCSLDWIARHAIDSEGALRVPEDQPDGRAYDRGWLVWGASLCGRYDLAFRLASDLATFQNAATGGFWDSKQDVAGGSGRHHAMTVGMAGWGLLSTRHVAKAQQAASFLLDLIAAQPVPRARLDLCALASGRGYSVVASTNPSDFIDCRGVRQRPARIGPAQSLLVRLYQLLGEQRYLDGAWAYTNVFLDGPDGMYDCVESHKFMWGLLELHQVSPDARLVAAADRIAEYIVRRQQPSGEWWADALGDGSGEQSLDLRLNTTCNALVGLASYIHMAPQA